MNNRITIPLIDLNKQYLTIKEEVEIKIQETIQNSLFIDGDEVKKFEIEFADYLNAKNCISVNSGTDALTIGIKSLNLNPGDEIIVPVNTFISSAFSISNNQLKPIFVEINNNFGINLEDLKKKINNRTRGVIVTHLYGQPENIEEVNDVIKKSKKKIYLIEDACQAHGAEYKGRKVGTFGIFSAFSFYPTKNLGAFGDGGAIITENNKIAYKCKLLKDYGQKNKYYYDLIGYNSRLDSLQAAILSVKLKYLDHGNRKRIEVAELYSNGLKNCNSIKIPKIFPERKSVYYVYALLAKQRSRLRHFLESKGIASLIHYPIPLHLQKAYQYLGYKKGDFPIAEKISSEIISIPMYPEIENNQINYVIDNIMKFYSETEK